jgi:5-formyltetrahydrofolate cyclo-ligase
VTDGSDRAAKRAVRDRVLQARDRLGPRQREALGRAIVARFIELPEVQSAGTIMTYVTFRSEVDTLGLIRWALAEGKTVAVPRVRGPRDMEAFCLRDPGRDLACGTWEIPEPCDGLEACDPQAIDLIVVPGTVFAADGGRIGYGGGFYDTYLHTLRLDVSRVALAFELQVVEELPRETHDLPVDTIVTERRVIRPVDRGRSPAS